MKKQDKLLIRNMVCQRCVMTVEGILQKLGLPYKRVLLGEVELGGEIANTQVNAFGEELKKVGFELIETRINKIVENIKQLVLSYVSNPGEDKKKKLSSYITARLHYDYSYLSDLFSSIEGVT